MKKHWSDALVNMRACEEAVEWARTKPDPETAWQQCERGDWMLWLAGKLSGTLGSDSRRPLVLAACACARLSLPYVRKGETRPLRAIEMAEAWATGGTNAPSLRDVIAAADAADAAASYAAAAAYAAESAAAASYAAAAAASYAERSKLLKQCAAQVRKIYPHAPVLP